MSGWPRILVCRIGHIDKHQELLVDYGDAYWDRLGKDMPDHKRAAEKERGERKVKIKREDQCNSAISSS